MKCDNCIYEVLESPSQGSPYPDILCSKGHWDGLDTDDMQTSLDENDPWEDCKDFSGNK